MSGNVPTLRRMDSGRLTAGYNHTTSTRDENSRQKWTIGTTLEVTAIKQTFMRIVHFYDCFMILSWVFTILRTTNEESTV